MQLNAFSASIMVAALVSGLLACFTWNRRPANASSELTFVLLAIAAWSFFAALEAISATVFLKVLFAILSYMGITTLPVLLLVFACRYVHIDHWFSRKNISLLFVIPLATLAIAATNHAHGLLWAEVSLGQSSFTGIYGIYEHGPWFWIHLAYSYLIVIIALVVLLAGMLRSRHIYQLHSRILIACSVVPLLANLLYVFFPQALQGVDITPVMFALSGILLFFALLHYKLLDLSPVAWQTIIESLDYGVVLFNKDNLVVDLNRSFTDYFELRKPKMGVPIQALLNPYPKIIQFIEQNQNKESEISLIKNNKKYFFQLECSPVYDRKGKDIVAKILLVKDITHKKKVEKQLRYLTFHDTLTGLYNRTYFEQELKRINRGIKRFMPVSVISIDINKLKDVNDTYGHHRGDRLIKDTAKILRSLVRKTDFLARIGGDEFCAILPNTLPEIAGARKEKLLEKIKAHNINNTKIPLSVAVGIASTGDGQNNIGEALKRADKAMYAQKREMKLKGMYPA